MIHQSVVDSVLDVIATELDVAREELHDGDMTWQEIGMDPILAKSIVKTIAQHTGVEMNFNVFDSCPDVDSLSTQIQALGRKQSTEARTPRKTTADTRAATGLGGSTTTTTTTPLSVLIQDAAASSGRSPRTMFLLPDGSGSAMAYARLRVRQTSAATKIIALNSPFLTDASRYTLKIEQLAELWAGEILRLQPAGAYTLGGWSAGGFYAFEVMKALQRRGKVVDRLVLIDSPCRTDFGALPVDVLRYLADNDLMGSWGARNAAAPGWLLEHFTASLRAVDAYRPARVSHDLNTQVSIIWAEDPLLSPEAAARSGLDLGVKVSRFLLAGRSDFGPNGWEKLLPRSSIQIARMPGHHFSIVHPPFVDSLGSLLSDILEESAVKRTQASL